MYKINHTRNNTTIFMSQSLIKELPHVIEIGHSFPPFGYETKQMHRNCFVLHYVISGKGHYYDQVIQAPCIFALTPNQLQYYKVDDHPCNPSWEQYWIMFSGTGIEQMMEEAGFPCEPICLPCPYMQDAIEIFQKLHDSKNYHNQNDYLYMMIGLLELFSLHAASISDKLKNNNNINAIVYRICDYIHQNYASITSEKELAQSVNFSANYVRRMFKEIKGTTPMRYLTEYRIHCAKKILRSQDLSISIIAETVGFSDPNYFCFVFKKYCNGLSPRDYRKLQQQS